MSGLLINIKKNMKIILVCGLSWLVGASLTPALAMDRLAALSMLESGNNDAAIGKAGEVTRFQIKPDLWKKYCRPYPVDARTNARAARKAAQAILDARCWEFKHRFHRPPTNFEFYVLWNAPGQILRPGKAVTRRASRFCSLVSS